MSNFCNGLTFHTNSLTFVVFKGYKLGCLVCTTDNPKLLGVLTYVWVLVGNIKVESKVSLVIWFSGFSAWKDCWWNLMKYQISWKMSENTLVFIFQPLWALREENNKSKIWCALLNLDWFHLTGKVPVLINILKFFLCTLHTGQ